MHYLIDGHNLIGQTPDIDLADPDDEMKLVMRLRRWTVADPRRLVTVIFDGGLFHGKSANLSGTLLTVIFSSRKQTADALLIKRLRALRNPQEFTLVSSDQAIIREAERRRVAVVRAAQFAAEMAAEAVARAAAPPPPPPPSPKEEPQLSEAEVDAWLNEFGPVTAPPPRPIPRRKPAAEAPAEPPPPPRPAATLKSSGDALTQAEVAEWLALFGEPQAPLATEDKAPPPDRPATGKKRAPDSLARPADTLKDSGASLSREEVDEWLSIFRKKP